MRTIIDQIRHLAESDPNFALEKDIFPLIYTRVPLLVVEFKNGVTVDIQFPNIDYHSIRNTNLVRHYAAVGLFHRKVIYITLLNLGRCSFSSIVYVVANTVHSIGREEQQRRIIVQLSHYFACHSFSTIKNGKLFSFKCMSSLCF